MFSKNSEIDFTKHLDEIIKKYSDTTNITLQAKVKLIPSFNKIKLATNYDEVIFSNYQYLNEYGENIALVHSYFVVEYFNINYEKQM